MKRNKKIGASFLVFVLLATSILAFPQLAQKTYAESYVTATVEDWTLKIYDGGESIIFSAYSGSSATVTIPTSVTYDGVVYT
nr:hypothetical protein [Eubacterium sp.]